MIKSFDLPKRTTKSEQTYNFRYDISFLRVLAVFAVVFYHYNIFPIRSGFVGVDIFFVISGYLMTKIILSGFEKKTFNLIEFYKRRVVRIFPALLVLLVLFSFIVFCFVPIQFFPYLRSAYSSSLFFSNIAYYLNNGYFSSASHNNFLLHTWSLSVEWQFYMIYPVILMFFRKRYHSNRNLFKWIFWCLIVVSFLSMMYHSIENINLSFYIFYTRAWEMLFGGLAFLYSSNFDKINRKAKMPVVILSYLILALSVVLFGSQKWPSIITIIPVLATTLIIGLNVNIKYLKNTFLKYLGDLSYSLYLYHWPIYVLAMFFGFNSSLQNRILLILVSIVCGVVSFEFIEKKSFFKNTKIVLFTALLIFLTTFLLSKINGIKYSEEFGNSMNVTNNYIKKEAKKQYNLGHKHFTDSNIFNDFDLSFLKVVDNGKKNVVLLGDSHGGMFAKTFENLGNDINLIQITADGTYPMINSKSELKECVNYFNYIFKVFFEKNKSKIDLVVISSNYAAYPENELEEKISFTNNYFANANIKHIYLGQTQTYPIEFPTYSYMKKRYNVSFSSENAIFEKNASTNNHLKQKLGNSYLDLLNYKIEYFSKDNYPYVYDMNHLTFYGTQQYKNIIEQKINSALF